MLAVKLSRAANLPLRILCIGAHCDDIEIGCGGTIADLIANHPESIVHWIVFSASEAREREALAGANRVAGPKVETEILQFRDGYFPFMGVEIKDYFENLKQRVVPDLVFTHSLDDRHQDHKLLAELTWNTFRDHLILEYEIAKYEGDLKTPTFYVPLGEKTAVRKAQIIVETFTSQLNRRWFSKETFMALMRLRGIECNAPSGYAEGFHCRKASLSV